MTPLDMDTVGNLVKGADKIVTPEEILLLAKHAGFPIGVADENLVEYGQSITMLVVRRMIMNAKMTFLAAYGYGTYEANGQYHITDHHDDDSSWLYSGDNIEQAVHIAYTWFVEQIS